VKGKGEFLFYFVAAPFVVSGLWWISPWLGAPALLVLFPVWIGSFVKIGE
jgi:hypothetical protein